MKKTALVLGTALLLLTACGGKGFSTGNDGDIEDTTELLAEADEEFVPLKPGDDGYVMPAERPTVLDFTAEWCGWCHKMEPHLQKVIREFDGRVNFQTVDVDDEPEIAKQYNITGMPTLVILDKDGKEITRIEGYTEAPDIAKALNQVLNQ